MNRSFMKSLLPCLAMILGPVPCAFAYSIGGVSGSSVVEPSQELPPLPEAPQSNQNMRQSTMPSLPVSHPCKQADIEGLWRLLRVYEEPLGNEMASFSSNPVQYVYYRPDGVYGKYNGDGALAAADQIISHIDKHATGLQQYLLQDTGLIYYYQDKVATTSQACFIVTKPRESFLPGEMLLMPQRGQFNGRLVKEYTKVPMPVATQAATAAATKGQNATPAAGGVVSDGAANPPRGHEVFTNQPIDPNDPVK